MERNQRVDYEINQSAQKEKALAWLPKVRAYYAGETHAHSLRVKYISLSNTAWIGQSITNHLN